METIRDEKMIEALEKELDTEILPGTEIMTDFGDLHFVKGSKEILVPQPSNDPHDPLNWSLYWKTTTIFAASFVTFSQAIGPLSLAPAFQYYAVDFDSSLTDVVQFTGVAILVLGFSNFIWVPLSNTYGRRPVYISSQFINLGSAIWRARAPNYGSFMGACVLNGIASGPGETIQPAVIADMFFLHDRGKWNTLYWVVYMGSLIVGPIINGPMSAHTSWRDYWWLNVGVFALSIILVIFMFPETKYQRPRSRPLESHAKDLKDESNEPGSSDGPTNVKLGASGSDNLNEQNAQLKTDAQDAWLGTGRPARWQWRLWQPNPSPLKSMVHDFLLPWRMFLFPIVQFASFVVSWACSAFLTLNLVQEQGFGPGTPYNYSAQTIGFFNLAGLIGALIGLFTAGPFSDWLSASATRRNRGIREPEMRLPAMIPYVFVMILGNVVVAVGWQNIWPWEAIVIIGFGAAGVVIASLPAIVSTYAVDSYKPVAGSLFVSITVNKNVWGYGFSKFITPWIIQVGFVPPIMTNMALITLWCLFGFLFYYKGKTFRRWTSRSSVHRVEM